MQLQGPRTFLARPCWRDYVVAHVLIALGFLLTSPAAPLHPVVGIALLVCGAVVLVCAIGWSLRSTWRSRRSREVA